MSAIRVISNALLPAISKLQELVFRHKFRQSILYNQLISEPARQVNGHYYFLPFLFSMLSCNNTKYACNSIALSLVAYRL